jgi:hypothetical protein
VEVEAIDRAENRGEPMLRPLFSSIFGQKIS